MKFHFFKLTIRLFFLLLLPTVAVSHDGRVPVEITQLIYRDQLSHEAIDSLNKLFAEFMHENTINDSTVVVANRIYNKIAPLNYPTGENDALINVCQAYLNVSNGAEALKYAILAYNLANQQNDLLRKAKSKMNIGLAYYGQNNFLRSNEHYQNSIDLYQQIGDSNQISRLQYLQAINLTGLGKYRQAMEKFLTVLKYEEVQKDSLEVSQCQVYISELLLKINNPLASIQYASAALIYLQATNNSYGEAKARSILAKAYLMAGDMENAERQGMRASAMADSLFAKDIKIDTYHTLSKTFENKADYLTALFYLKKYQSVKDSIFNEKNARIISKLETDQEIAQQQNEILLLEKENKNRNLLLKGSLIIGIMFLLLFILLYSRYFIKKRANEQLTAAYDNLRKTQEQLISHEKMASLGHLTAGIAHEIKNPLNFVNNFSSISLETIQELDHITDENEKKELLDELKSNLEKIQKHGKRADSIVRNMLDHSRTGNSEKSYQDVNQLCSEYCTLSFQGIRAQHPMFSCKIEMELDPNLPKLFIAGQEFSRVLINIFNNAFYALMKKSQENIGFVPVLTLLTYLEDNWAVIKVRDNGPGISQEVKERIFEPFFTTKPTGEGTGLGLSISYDIINSHGGKLIVNSEPGNFTEMLILLPTA